jgi:hypothetical protein
MVDLARTTTRHPPRDPVVSGRRGLRERRWRDVCPRGAKRINDDVEDLVLVAVVLDVPLEERRGNGAGAVPADEMDELRAP